ncbi:hypothetical protein M406DRAFT_75150 [Cryphonectria parasitica EP155]|uniref:SCP domain-containing protein n=1 Tax=Cryphonectria parasitica (strain ATCC 38755 / EP155) TaxID=660469 RepID=A0A9P4XZR9_CRYP1|nr:uncharacterized protein M406DRAFT_75150 [Cryphonectria parasitica EP155]KAF3763921.1 hypothetical protein M406DRAFT_75150 [Cryphonectria parasitica EP155]
MYFSTRPALAALLVAGGAVVQACPPKHHQSSSAAAVSSSTVSIAAKYSATWTSVLVAPTTTSAVVVPTTTSSSSSIVVVTTSATPSTTSSAAAASSTASSGLTSDQSAALDTQNGARSDVGETALTWSTTLASDAQSWAEHLASLGSPGDLVHSSGTGQGENLYWQSDASDPYANAATAWVDEKSSYSGEAIEDDSAFENYGHYTQIIWSSTTEVGMGIASDGAGGYYVVARYTPEGNVIGETPTTS